jgi:ATP:ADP antiporter, AAA family
MWTRLGKLLQIAQGDRMMIAALLVQAFCTGIFVGALELEANTVFLEAFGADRVPFAMMVSGVAGILIAAIYGYFSKQLKARAFGIINLVVVIGATAFLAGGLYYLERDYFDFATFVFSGPLILITLLGFRTTVRGFISPSRGKQLGGLIEVTLVGGMALAFASVPIIVSKGIGIHEILYLGMGSLILATGFQMYILSHSGSQGGGYRSRNGSAGPIRLFSHRYTALMASFVVIGVAVTILLHFQFLSVTQSRFPGGSELVEFLGLFFGIAVMLAWIMKRFLFHWIKSKFGIRMTLLIIPVVLLLLTIPASIFGESYGYGGGNQLFAYFFMLIVLSNLFSRSMKESMELPSMNLIYQSLNPRERENVQSGIEGVFSQIGVFSAGLFLSLFVMLRFVELFHVTYVLFVLLLIWLVVGLSLYRSYHRLLKVTLESDRIYDLADLSLEEIEQFDLEHSSFSMELIEFNPYFFHYVSRERQLSLLSHSDAMVRRVIWDHILKSSPGLEDIIISQMLTNEREPDIKERIRSLKKRKLKSKLGLQEAFIRERLNKFNNVQSEPDNSVAEVFRSGSGPEILAALYYVAEAKDKTFLPEVVSLFRDRDPEIQGVAISTAGWLDLGGNAHKLIVLLNDPILYRSAWSTLVRQGENVLDELEMAFYKPDADIKLQTRIVSVISSIGGVRAVQLLLQKLEYQHRDVFQSVVRGLYANNFEATAIQETQIQNAILRMIQAGSWIMAAKISVRTDDPGGHLAKVIDLEIWEINELILLLLTMIYDRRSVRRIKISLLDRQSDDRQMAIELLEMLVREPLKTVIVSYFHDVSVREKLDKLKELYPIDIFPVDILLKRILNRNGVQMGDFIKICVLDRVGNVERFFDEQQIIAQGFHPNPRIREIAAQLLRKNNPEQYNLVTERLDFPDNSFPGHEDMVRWYLDTTVRLTSWKLFMNVGINSLFKIVSIARPFSDQWSADGDSVILARSFTVEGFSNLSNGIAIITAYQPEIMEQIRYLSTIGACEAFLIERKEFVELLFDDRSLLHVFCGSLNQASSMKF